MGGNLTRTPSSAPAAERRKYTISCWIKMQEIGAEHHLIYAYDSGNSTYLRFGSNAKLRFRLYDGGDIGYLESDTVFRDSSAWYHVVLQFNTYESSSADRIKMYVNGTKVTDLGTDIYPSSEYMGLVNYTIPQQIPSTGDGDSYFADYYMCAGYIYAPTVFANTDSVSGQWKAITDPTVSYGTNGFHLKFENAANMGLDSSGNGNNFTSNSEAANPQRDDTPSNNFPQFNDKANRYWAGTFDRNNLRTQGGNSQATFCPANMGVEKGKWYYEYQATNIGSGTDNNLVGAVSRPDSVGTSDYLGESTSVVFRNNGTVKYNGTNYASQGPSWTTSDIIAVALDIDNNRITFSKNGQWIDGSGNADEASPTSWYTFPAAMQTDAIAFPCIGDLSTNSPNSGGEFNFGQPVFGISSAQTDAAGYGKFEYTPPTGFYAICTKNIGNYG
jgi:hypothetical protein